MSKVFHWTFFFLECIHSTKCSAPPFSQWNDNKNNGQRNKFITQTHESDCEVPWKTAAARPSQMLRGRYRWWMESLTSSRSGMMAWHLSEVLRSHCDQILLCPCFIVVTAWGMLGFVLPTVAIHHLWRKRKRAQWHFAFHLQPPTPTHTHTFPCTHSLSLLRHPVFTIALAPSFTSSHVCVCC